MDEDTLKRFELQLEMLFTVLRCNNLATDKAQEFFSRASRYGLPGYEDVRFCDNYIVSYDNENKYPRWVLDHAPRSGFIQEER